MVLCIYGFPTNISALQVPFFSIKRSHLRYPTTLQTLRYSVLNLKWIEVALNVFLSHTDVFEKVVLQFEWAWQHPRESRAVREAAAAFKSFSGLARNIKLAYTMLTLPAWNR